MASSSKPTFSCAIFNVLFTELVNKWIDVAKPIMSTSVNFFCFLVVGLTLAKFLHLRKG